mgnify:CR=1 FL=1
MPEASILVTLRDQYSPGVQTMRSANSGFGKSLEETRQKAQAYETRLAALVKQQGQLQVELVDAKKALKEAETAYKATGDAADADALASAKEKYEALNTVIKETAQASKDTQNALRELEGQNSRMSRQSGGSSMLSALGQAGILAMAGNTAGQWANTLVGSAFGGNAGSLFSSALSGAASGAALGSLTGPIGTAVGAAIGGAIGLATGGNQIYEARDEAFRSYYTGLYDTAGQATADSLAAGSSTAAQRELDAIAFNRLLGEGAGDQYLEDLRALAAETPMEYSDLTSMSRALATGFGDDIPRMLELMTAIGDAGSAVGVSAADMTSMAQAMSRMNSSGKAALEYLNIFQDRGMDVIGMLAEAMGKTQGEIYDMISKSEISGQDAVDIIQSGLEDAYAGSMEIMAQTYPGLTSTLNDTMAEIENAMGEAYNKKASKGLQADIDAYGGALGEALSQANSIIGEGRAIAENLDRQYSREALSALTMGTSTTVYGEDQAARLKEMHSQYTSLVEQYQSATEEDKAVIASQIEALTEEAQAMADSAYDASEMSQSLHDVNLDLIAAIRENTAALGSTAWGQAYDLQQEQSKGLTAETEPGTLGLTGGSNPQRSAPAEETGEELSYVWVGNPQRGGYKLYSDGTKGYATGLARVPYDNFPALLHEGERVLTAAEARGYNQGGSGGFTIVMNGTTIREDADIDRVAQALLEKLRQAQMAGVG